MKRLLIILLLLISTLTHAKTILFLGDSLTEGYGIDKSDAYPALIEKMITEKIGKKIKVINGGVSGSTTSDAMARLKWYAKRKPEVLILALGSNDGLRGVKLEESKKNLQEIIDFAKAKGMKVLLTGMIMPPNYGPKYTEQFKSMYAQLEKKNKLKHMPFFLEGVAGLKKYNQRDGIHPNEEGHKVLAEKVFQFIKDEI